MTRNKLPMEGWKPMTDEEIAVGVEKAMSEGSLQKLRTIYAEGLEQARKARATKNSSEVTELS